MLTRLFAGITTAIATFISVVTGQPSTSPGSIPVSAPAAITIQATTTVPEIPAPVTSRMKTTATSSIKATLRSAATPAPTSSYGPVLSENQLQLMASNTYASGEVPLGDYHYVTTGPKKGYVYLCDVHLDNPGSAVNGPWIHGTTWNFLEKLSVGGSVSWPNATFQETLVDAFRTFMGNDLPINHTTGVFPVSASEAVHQYDANPNTIGVQNLNLKLPANPTYSNSPYCMGGEVGIMLSGVPLFNAFDAGLRDAPAHEAQDSCDGHPQGSEEYHYHSLSTCFKDIGETTVLGYALDGFPITGPLVGPNKYLTTDDLDECHGITSEINIDGQKKVTYHYVMTQDFPYSASCFRGKPSTYMVIQGTGGPQQSNNQQASNQNGMPQMNQSGMQGGQPPQEAITSCTNKTSGSTCSFSTPRGTISGSCQTPPAQSQLICVPNQ